MAVSLSHGVGWLREDGNAYLLDQAQKHAPNETGGLLLGYRHSPTEAVITDAIGPGPEAKHRASTFEPDYPWQADQLAHCYPAQDRRIAYLGDWHTHPFETTKMSTQTSGPFEPSPNIPSPVAPTR